MLLAVLLVGLGRARLGEGPAAPPARVRPLARVRPPVPPKKEEEPVVPIITWNILALTPGSSSAIEALNKPVTLKHLVNTQKMIQLLKEKGIDEHVN